MFRVKLVSHPLDKLIKSVNLLGVLSSDSESDFNYFIIRSVELIAILSDKDV